ncbi:MAG: hypothetical protein ACK55Z_37820, partial [bacterium]
YKLIKEININFNDKIRNTKGETTAKSPNGRNVGRNKITMWTCSSKTQHASFSILTDFHEFFQ